MKIDVGGIEAFVATIDKWDKQAEKYANKEVLNAAMRTVAQAKVRLQPLPEDDPETTADITAVRGSINFIHYPNNISSMVYAGNTKKDHFAAYLDFGTGPHAAKYVKTLPFEYEALAWQFFVNGEGTMRPHPYLTETYIEEGKRFVDRLKGLRPLT